MNKAGHVADVGQIHGPTNVWSENLKETDHLEDLSIDGRKTKTDDVQYIGTLHVEVQWNDIFITLSPFYGTPIGRNVR